MNVKANLKVILMANDVEVAESTDPMLWQNVFAAINQGTGQLARPPQNNTENQSVENNNQLLQTPPNLGGSSDALSQFAAELGITKDEVEGALGPSQEAPFLHLDAHCWEALKKNTPPRGPQSVAPIALAGTVLGLWFKHLGIEGIPNKKQCQAVLRTIHISDKNAARSLKNTEWLQSRGDGIVINPAQRSRAVSLAASFCKKTALPTS